MHKTKQTCSLDHTKHKANKKKSKKMYISKNSFKVGPQSKSNIATKIKSYTWTIRVCV